MQYDRLVDKQVAILALKNVLGVLYVSYRTHQCLYLWHH
jgi:hypothetical protein